MHRPLRRAPLVPSGSRFIHSVAVGATRSVLVVALGAGLALGGCVRGEIGGRQGGSDRPVPETPGPVSPDDFIDPPIQTSKDGGQPPSTDAAGPPPVQQPVVGSDAGGAAVRADGAPPAGPSDGGTTAPDGRPSVEPVPPRTDGAVAMPGPPGPCNLKITEVALYQAVKVPLVRDGAAIAMRAAPIIQKRPALVRAFVQPEGGAGAREVEARLVLKSPEGETILTDKKTVERASDEATLATTLNFNIPADEIGPATSYAVEVTTPSGCATNAAARAPSTGDQNLGAIRTGTLKVKLVPIKYDADGSGRLPDTSATQIKRYTDYLMAMYPVEKVELTVREPVSSTVALTASGNWAMVLDQMRSLRARDAPSADIYYYGLVNPAATGPAYCNGGCVAGIAYRGSAAAAAQRAGLGLGFTTGVIAPETMAHEIGHSHGRLHAPCGNVKDADPDFPGGMGDVGAWGYNLVTAALISPMSRKDIMGYCNPKWISPFTYAALAQRGQSVNDVGAAPLEIGAAPARAFRVLLLDKEGDAAWGLPTKDVPYGDAEEARVLDASGAAVATVTVFRTPIPDFDSASLLVPEPRAGWESIQVAGATRPLSFSAKVAVPAFGP